MFLEIMNPDNYGSFNITLAKIVGLEGAIYCSELLSSYKKAKKNNTIIGDEFFELNREDILNRTTIAIKQQLEIDERWTKIKLLYKHSDTPNIIKLDTQLLASIIEGENVKIKDDLAAFLVPNITVSKVTKRKQKIDTLKEGITCSNPEVLKALRTWVDALSTHPGKSKITGPSIEIFQDTLYKYAGGNPTIAIDVIKIATIQKYIDCQWAINLYEKNKRMNSNLNTTRTQKLDIPPKEGSVYKTY